MLIDKIFIHHAGTIGSNSDSYNQTWKDINLAHKHRWNFPSEYIKDSYGGYNFCYDPKDRTIHQFRALGEETAAQKGNNHDSISLCIIGNYSLYELAPHAKIDVVNLLIDLCKGNYRDFVIARDAKFQLTPFRIFPHQAVSDTECPGANIKPDFFRDQVKMRIYPQVFQLQDLLNSLRNLVLKLQNQVKTLGKADTRED